MKQDRLVISYLTLRKVVGILGATLPFVLIFGGLLLFGTSGRQSISSYYHTDMRDVFVGTLCVIGFFLFAYRGYNRLDNILGNLACVFALGVAFFPTTPVVVENDTQIVIGYIHLASAAFFFLTLIYFSLFLFTKSGPGEPTVMKVYRNRVYRFCGYVMSCCIVGIFIYYLLPTGVARHLEAIDPVFWFEATAVLFFGISWLTKGEAILPDKWSSKAGEQL